MGYHNCAVATDGSVLDLDSMETTYNYNVDDTLNYMEILTNGNTYRQSFTWDTGKVATISRWVKQ